SLIEALERTPRREDAVPLYAEFQRLIRDEQPWTIIYYYPDLFIINERVRNADMDIRGAFTSLGQWWLEDGAPARSDSAVSSRSLLDSAVHEVQRSLDRGMERATVRESGRDGGRQRAAGAVPCSRAHARPAPLRECGAVVQHVDDFVAGEVPAFHESRTRAALHERAGSMLHLRHRLHWSPDEQCSLVEVGGDECDEGQLPLRDRTLLTGIEQSITARRYHHGISDDVLETVGLDAIGNGSHDVRGCQHAGLERRGPQVRRDRVELGVHELGGHRVHALYTDRVLRRESRDDGRAERAKRVEGLQVRLDAGAAAAVAAGDRECYRNGCHG